MRGYLVYKYITIPFEYETILPAFVSTNFHIHWEMCCTKEPRPDTLNILTDSTEYHDVIIEYVAPMLCVYFPDVLYGGVIITNFMECNDQILSHKSLIANTLPITKSYDLHDWNTAIQNIKDAPLTNKIPITLTSEDGERTDGLLFLDNHKWYFIPNDASQPKLYFENLEPLAINYPNNESCQLSFTCQPYTCKKIIAQADAYLDKTSLILQ